MIKLFAMERKIKFSEGEYYHIYNRGVDKRDIFMDGADYSRFLVLLYLSNSVKSGVHIQKLKSQGRTLTSLFEQEKDETLVDIGSYCLMPNHFHILIREKKLGGVSDFMKKLLTGYSMYFNKRYDRHGPLFQSRFKAEHAISDNYLKYLYSYIHLNPIKLIQLDWKEKGIEDIEKAKYFLESYEYSSYLDYLQTDRKQKNILNKKNFPEYFIGEDDFQRNIFDWLEFVKVRP